VATTAKRFVTKAGEEQAERGFFRTLTILIALGIVAGFSLNLATGRSTFAVPWPYHAHAFVFFGWVALFVTQSVLISDGNAALHRTLGTIAYLWVPLMVVMGLFMITAVMHRNGGPFFFAQNVFLFSNPAHLLAFALLTLTGLRVRRHAGWHRRLLICGFAILSGPGLGRIIPLYLTIPYGWHVMLASVLVFPVAGMIRDKRRTGRVHPAWLWGVGTLLVFQAAADMIAYSQFGIDLTRQFLAGTPGAERPMEAFLPPGFAM